MGLNSTRLPSPLLAPPVTSTGSQKSFRGLSLPIIAPPCPAGASSLSGMTQPLSKRTPIANDPVGSLVGEFMEEKRRERQEEKARQVPKKRNPFLVPLLMALCAAIWVAPSLMPPREPVLTQETLENSAKLTLYLASIRVRSYLDTHKRLPPTLAQAGVDTTGLSYVRTSNSVFELSTRVQGTRLVYRSTIPDSVFLGPNLRVRGIS